MPAEVLDLFQVESLDDVDPALLDLLVPEKNDAPLAPEFESSKFSSLRSFGNFLDRVIKKLKACEALRHSISTGTKS